MSDDDVWFVSLNMKPQAAAIKNQLKKSTRFEDIWWWGLENISDSFVGVSIIKRRMSLSFVDTPAPEFWEIVVLQMTVCLSTNQSTVSRRMSTNESAPTCPLICLCTETHLSLWDKRLSECQSWFHKKNIFPAHKRQILSCAHWELKEPKAYTFRTCSL